MHIMRVRWRGGEWRKGGNLWYRQYGMLAKNGALTDGESDSAERNLPNGEM